MYWGEKQKNGSIGMTFFALLLVLCLIPSWAMAEDILESPPQTGAGFSAPCLNMPSISNTVHFEGNRWLQVCTDGSVLEGYIMDYGIGTTSKIISLSAEEGIFFQSPRAAVMAAGGIVVLWNQTTDQFQVNTDTPIFMAKFDYDGRQITPVQSLQEGDNK
jgi:hypothetical protein